MQRTREVAWTRCFLRNFGYCTDRWSLANSRSVGGAERGRSLVMILKRIYALRYEKDREKSLKPIKVVFYNNNNDDDNNNNTTTNNLLIMMMIIIS
jgi:hypothetical protein